jgi:formate dehydrogenase subunit gamma
MKHDLMKRFTDRERMVHWVHMVTFIVLVLTGLGLYARSFFGLTGLFGGVDISRAIHHWAGVLFALTTVAVFLQWFKDITAPGDDTMITVVRNYFNPALNVAPSGKFNAGQKMTGWVALVLGLIISISGFAMWFPFLLGRGIQQWMYLFHNLAFIVFIGFMMLHAYLGTVGVPGTWRAMSKGTVTRAWGRKNHPKWDAEEA